MTLPGLLGRNGAIYSDLMLHIEEQVQNRINSLLKPLDEQTLRSRHEQFSVALRREDRNSRTAKRRLALQPPLSDNEMTPASLSLITACLKSKEVPAPDQFELLLSLLDSASSTEERLVFLRTLRRVCGLDLTQRVDILNKLTAVEKVIQLYRRSDHPEIKKEAYWALCNLCASPLAPTVVHQGGIDIFWQGLWSTDGSILELSLWGLGNISGDSDQFRDQLLLHGLQNRVVELVEKCESGSELERVCVWVLGNLVGGASPVPMSICAGILPIFCAVLDHPSPSLVKEALWGLYKVCWEEEPRIQAVLNTGHAPQVLSLLQAAKRSVSWAALKVVGRLLQGSVHQVQALLNLGLLGHLHTHLQYGVPRTRKEVLWCLSNICSQTSSQAMHLLSSPIFADTLSCVADPQESVRLEASWVLSNAAVVGQYSGGVKMVGMGVCQAMTTALGDANPTIVFNMLEVCESLLECGEREAELSGRNFNCLIPLFESTYGTVEALERATNCRNEKVSNKAASILQRFFSPESSDYLASNSF